MALKVTVVIVGFQNPGDIGKCLAALTAQTYTEFDVMICENGGGQAYEALMRAIPARLAGGQQTTLLDAGGNLGFAGGVNLCMNKAPSPDAWWLLNPDTRPHAGALAALVARLERGDCDAVGGKLHWPNGRIQSYGGRWRPWLARGVSLGMGRRLEAEVDPALIEGAQTYLSGASMLVGRRFVEFAGRMREDYFLYCEEVEWCLRARAAGARLGFAPEARVEHSQGSTTGAGGLPRSQPRLPVYLNERNRLLLTRDRFPWRLPVAGVAALALVMLRYGRRGAWPQLRYGLGGWWAGIANVRGAAL